MAAAYSNSWGNATPNHPLAVATSPTIHDVLIFGGVTDTAVDGPLTSLPTGFSADVSQATTADGQTLLCAHKNDASGSEGSISFSNSGPHQMIGFVLAASGIDNTTPLDVAVVVANNNTATATPWTVAASATPVTNGCLLVAVMGSDVTGGKDAVHTFNTTSGLTSAWTPRQDLNSWLLERRGCDGDTNDGRELSP
jgi:hypothetical protein